MVNRRELARAALSRLLANRQEIALYVALAAFSLWVRRLTLQPIETGGDAVRNWHFVRQWAFNDFSNVPWDHHMPRFGVHVFTYAAQRLFGTHPNVYYVAPVVAATLETIFCYAVTRRLAGPFTAILAAVGLTISGPLERAGSQLLPSAFEGMYALAATYALVRHADHGREGRGFLVAGAVMTFGAYLSKSSNLLFLPGLLVAVWLARRSVKDIVWFSGILLALVLVETALYSTFTRYPSQIAIVSESHRNRTLIKNVWQLFDRFEELPPGTRFSLFSASVSSLGLLAFSPDRRAKAVVLIGASFVFGLTFALRGLHPMQAWVYFDPRYFDPVVGFPWIVNALWLAACARALFSGGVRRWARWTELPARQGVASGLLMLAVAGRYHSLHGDRLANRSPYVENERALAAFDDAFRRRLPIVSPVDRLGHALRVVLSMYVSNDAALKNGRLPSFEEASAPLVPGIEWVSVDPRRFAADARRRHQAGECVLTVRNGVPLLYTPGSPLPAGCGVGSP